MELKEQMYITEGWFDHFPLGQEDHGRRHWLDAAEMEFGGDEDEVTYYFNEYRYRGQIIPSYGTPASFGCSNTMGYGVNKPYPERIQFANLGISGMSNDGIARLAYLYCEHFEPPIITVMWTYKNRREHVKEDGVVCKFRNQKNMERWMDLYTEIQNPKLDEYNYIKNKIFLQNYCENKKIKLIELEPINNDRGARDGCHPSSNWHTNIAAEILSKL